MPGEGQPDDAALVARSLTGDQDAFRELYQRYAEKVMATVLRIVGDREDALDLLQEIFLKVHQELPNFRGESRFSTWLYRVAVNFSINRVNARERHRLADRKLAIDTAFENPGPEALPISPERIQDAIQGLTPKLRAVVALRYLEGFSYEEIAQVLDLEIGTVKSRLHLAHEALRENLLGYLPE